MLAKRKFNRITFEIAKFVAYSVIWWLGVSQAPELHPPLIAIVMLTCFGLFHFVQALKRQPLSRGNYHWWYVLAAALASIVLLLVHNLFRIHDQRGYWGWVLVILASAAYFAVMVRALTGEAKPEAKAEDYAI